MRALSVIGAAVAGYRIIAPLGVGATGAVYVAEQPLLGRRVAVKILHRSRAEDTAGVATFLADTGTVQDLAHPQIAEILEVSTVETPSGELPAVITELLEGQTLAELLADGPLAPVRALVIAEQIAEALEAAHARGIVHGDLKAENVFLVRGIPGLDRVKLLDFGVWHFRPPHGTTAYLAPEQCIGDEPDTGVDIYALGALLFEMLTGEPPLAPGGLGDMVLAHLFGSSDGPPRPSDRRPGLPVSLDPIVARALEKHPEHRFPTMGAMLAALRYPMEYDVALELPRPVVDVVPAVAAAPPPPPAPVEAPRRAPAERERRRGAIFATASAATAAVLGILTIIAAAAAPPSGSAPTVAVAAADPPIPADTVALVVGSCAPAARVFLDGVDVGPAGQSLQVKRGQPLDVTVKAPGFLPFTQQVLPQEDILLEAVLVPRTPEPRNI